MKLKELPFEILDIIANFLNFNDKLNFDKYCEYSFIKFYNFYGRNYSSKEITDIFSVYKTDETADFILEATSDIYIDSYLILYYYYDDYCKYKNGKNEEDESEDDDSKNDDSKNDDEYNKEHNLSKLSEDEIDEIVNKIRFIFGGQSFEYGLIDLKNSFVLSNYSAVYARKFIEIVEDNNLQIKYNKNIDIFDYNILPDEYDVHNEVYKYLKYVLLNGYDIDIFCRKCGTFGHNFRYNPTDCCFYNKGYMKRKLKEHQDYITTQELEEKKRKEKEELNRLRNLELTCKKCNKYFFSTNCINKECANCCFDITCKKHKTKNIKNVK